MAHATTNEMFPVVRDLYDGTDTLWKDRINEQPNDTVSFLGTGVPGQPPSWVVGAMGWQWNAARNFRCFTATNVETETIIANAATSRKSAQQFKFVIISNIHQFSVHKAFSTTGSVLS